MEALRKPERSFDPLDKGVPMKHLVVVDCYAEDSFTMALTRAYAAAAFARAAARGG